MHYSKSTLFVERDSDEHCDSGKIVLDEIGCSVQWVDPDNSILGTKSLKWINLDLICSIIPAQSALNPRTALFVLLIQEILRDESLYIRSDLIGIN